MKVKFSATKANLIKIKKTLEFSRSGYDLMDRKRNILIREMMTLIDEAKEIQAKIDDEFTKAYAALQYANISMGISNIDSLAQAVPEEDGVQIRYKSVMGVEVPELLCQCKPAKLYFELSNTNSMLDEAYLNFHEVKAFTLKLAAVENSIYKLAYAIKKTQKRANALSNIIIPGYEKAILEMTAQLDEKEREEFSRLKVIKGRM